MKVCAETTIYPIADIISIAHLLYVNMQSVSTRCLFLDIVGSVLYMSENLTYLGHLRQKYPSPALQRNFSDILLKCRLIMESKCA